MHYVIRETGYGCNTFCFSNYNSLNFIARVLKFLYKVLTFVHYKWHQFNPLQVYHRLRELMSNTYSTFVTTYPNTVLG